MRARKEAKPDDDDEDAGSARRLPSSEIIEDLKTEKETLQRKLKSAEDAVKELRNNYQGMNELMKTLNIEPT